MGKIEVLLPKMGESVAEATITTWLKNVGDTVEEEEPIVEIATDKVDSEVPSPASGVIKEILVPEGEVAQVGQVIAVIAGEGEDVEEVSANGQAAQPEPVAVEESAEEAAKEVPFQPAASSVAADIHISKTSGGRFYSPLVRNIAKTEGITQEELDRIPGTGKDNRVTKNDILNYLKNRDSQQQVSAQPQTTQAKKEEPEPAPKPEKPAPQPSTSSASQNYSGNVEIIEMDRMRKLIAEHMVHSKHTSPHVTSFVEADVTKIVNWRNKVKKQFLDKYNEKITFTPIFIEAIVKAINDYPMINVSVDGDKIIKKNYINIGMATALPSGNLIVPVIKNANMLNLVGLTKAVNDLANRARNNQLKPDEIQDGTFTLTNVGTFGNVMGTPIINQPQVAILATGAIQKKPAVIEAPEGDMIGIRHKMFLSLSYDHRVVDGALGGSFLRRIADYLEAFDEQREI